MTSASRTAELTYERQGETLRGYAAWPPGRGPFPGLVVIHDVRGLYEHYRAVARRFAAAGFFTFAPDLYSREGPPDLPDMEAVARWIAQLRDPRVLADIQRTVEFVAAHPDVRSDAVGITGFCLGGQYAFMAACRVAHLSACVSWYGMLRYHETNERKPVSPLDLAPDLACPYLGLFGEEDALIPGTDVAALRSILDSKGKRFEIKTYPGAGHAFFNDTRPDAYRPDAAADAWRRAIAFLREHLTS